jgi:hypothetical protein
MNKEDLTILIAGPLNKISLDNLDYYKSIGKVVISYWENDSSDILTDYNLDDVLCVRRPLPRNQDVIYAQGYGTFAYQVCGIYNGLSVTNTKYVIRTRSDEMFGNLQPLIEKFEQDTNKVVCGNIFFKRWITYGFHHGDHLFVGRTNHLIEAYKKVVDGSLINIPPRTIAEAITAFAILESVDKPRTKEAFMEVFDVVDTNELKPFISNFRQAGETYVNEFHKGHHSTITCMEEL